MPPSPYRERFSNGYQGAYPVQQFGPGKPKPNAEDLQFVVAQYDGEIALIDDLLALFFKQLERRGLMHETLVVVLSDHGDEFYEHGACDHIRSLFDELVRVPRIMFGPSIPPVEVHTHVGTIDVLPTVLSLFDLHTDTPIQGTDRSNLLSGSGGNQDASVFSHG